MTNICMNCGHPTTTGLLCVTCRAVASEKEAVNEIVERLLSENSQLKNKLARLTQLKSAINMRITLALVEKQSAEQGGHDRDALRLDGAIATLESLLEDIEG